jgi:hypothetical protein
MLHRFALMAGLGLVCAALAQQTAPAVLYHDDFSHLNGAIQEYHYLPGRGVPLGPWENSIAHLDAWVAGD